MFNSIPPVTRNIIIINIAVFVIANLLFQDRFVGYLAAFYPFSPFFKSWQIVTHMFMHGSFMHILFNMFTLFSFGPILENSLGEKKYLILYFLSGLGAFFLFNLWNFVEVQQISSELQQLGFNLNEYLSGSSVQYSGSSQSVLRQQELVGELNGIMGTPMVGASGAIFGVVAAFATLYPDAKIGIMFIPIPMKVKYVLPVVVIGSIYLGVSGNGGGIAHLAHVGGAIVGFILARIWRKHLYRFN
ncbi:rhomboid family intramembrane serine protease [Chryseobacterium gambrini]|uniref:Membrane associated serine protease, rhomboid family n=1 Tax=Chryseobacterium gambrini TaxID=373672 RepID=A0A1N7MCF8_9FLAO|nr:rhomboid family intramembrane serine protease [Chryseobacterium gambrini]BEV05238.1 rhomboid family intramembrane serine protease [Chryseobacterium gambrini]SIS83727.1 Membrane associated serine protease, rhomboid family [Chryseobacterium gambrini]HAO08797.1 rhomboid family intramembrane serine protease [Chryseobacterium sp.]